MKLSLTAFALKSCAISAKTTFLLLSFVLFSSAIPGGEFLQYDFGRNSTSVTFDQQMLNPLDLSPDILLVIRIANLQEWGAEIDTLMQSIAPYSDALSIDTLQIIGNFLRNPGLDNISENAFFELLLFVPREDRQSPVVVAFPVKEPQTYIRLLSNRAAMSSQVAPDGIIHLREQNIVTTDFYLCTTNKRIAIFGQSREAVSKARVLYENSGESLSPIPTGDIELYLHLKKMMSIYSSSITTAFEQLHNDLVADLTYERAGLTEPAGRLVADALADLKSLSEEISKIHIVLKISKTSDSTEVEANDTNKEIDKEIYAQAEINFETGNISKFLNHSVNREPTLVKYLPAQTISLEWSSHENEGTRQIITGLAGEIESGFTEPIDSVSRKKLDNIFTNFLSLGITEMASGTIAAPVTDFNSGPSHIILAELSQPKRLKLFLEEFQQAFAKDSPLISSLNRNSIAVSLEREPVQIGDMRAEVFSYTLKITGKDEPGVVRPEPVNFSGSYHLLLFENILACASGPHAEGLIVDFAKTISANKSAFESSFAGAQTIKRLADKRFLWASMIAPIQYINMALQSQNALTEDSSATNTQNNGKKQIFTFPSLRKHNLPFIMTLASFDAGRLSVARATLHLPHRSLKQVMQALLVDNSENE